MFKITLTFPHTGKTKELLFATPRAAELFALSAQLVGIKTSFGYDKSLVLGPVDPAEQFTIQRNNERN